MTQSCRTPSQIPEETMLYINDQYGEPDQFKEDWIGWAWMLRMEIEPQVFLYGC
jgi:hypothetical protein